MLIMFWIICFFTVFRDFFYKHLTYYIPSLRVGHLELDEDLDNYFNTLDDHDRHWSISEEENARSVLKMRIMSDETLQKLKSTHLANPN